MKSIASDAMAAIEAGEAIVTGALEIIPVSFVLSFTPVGTVDVAANTAGVPVTLGPFDADDVLVVTKPGGLTHAAWSRWSSDGNPLAAGLPWTNDFWVTDDGSNVAQYWFGSLEVDGDPTQRFASAAAAEAAFAGQSVSLTGSTTYTFDIQQHTPITDDRGGLSLMVKRGVTGGLADPIRVWGGYGPITIDGQVYLGIGDRGLAQQSAGAIGGVAQGLVLTLSGIEPQLLELLDGDEIKSAAVVLRRLIFASDGKTLLDAHVFDRGRIDTVETDETIGQTATIRASVESAARGLGRAGARQRSDSDQRLINSSDGYFKQAAYAGEKMLYWGGRRPSRSGGAVGGGGGFVGAMSGLIHSS